MALDRVRNTGNPARFAGWVLVALILLALAPVPPVHARIAPPVRSGDILGDDGTPYEEPEYVPPGGNSGGGGRPLPAPSSPQAPRLGGSTAPMDAAHGIGGLHPDWLIRLSLYLRLHP